MPLIKKLLILVTLAITITFTSIVSANNFKAIWGNDKSVSYIDPTSVKVILYNPPYYIIDIKQSIRNYVTDQYGVMTVRYFYNLNTNTMEFRPMDLIMTSDAGKTWTSLYRYPQKQKEQSIIPHSSYWYIGNYAFYKAYKMYFTNDFKEEYGNKDLFE